MRLPGRQGRAGGGACPEFGGLGACALGRGEGAERSVRVEPLPAQCAGGALNLVHRQAGQVHVAFGGTRRLYRFQGAA